MNDELPPTLQAAASLLLVDDVLAGLFCREYLFPIAARLACRPTDAPTGAPTNATNAPTPSIVRRRALLEKGSSFIDESVWFQRALAADKSGVVQSLRDIWGY